MFSPFRIFFPVLWPLLTSCRSLLLRIFFASARPPRVLTHSFPLYLPHLPKAIPCSYWALFCYANLPSLTALYAISVRQARVLPIGRPFNSQNPAFFRFHLTMDLLFSYTLPTIWACSGLTPVRARPWRANQKAKSALIHFSLLLFYTYLFIYIRTFSFR